MEVQLGRPVADAKVDLELLETGHFLASFETQSGPLRVVIVLPDRVLRQIGLAIGVMLQLQGPDGGQAWGAEVDEESMKDGLRADDKCDLLIEEMMSFPMDLLACQEHGCQTGQGLEFWPHGRSSIRTPCTLWLERATSSFKRFRAAQRRFGLLAPWIPRRETAAFTEWKDLEDVLFEVIVVYLDTELSRELKKWKDFEELGWMRGIKLDNLGVGGLAGSTLVNGLLVTWVSAVDRFAVDRFAVDGFIDDGFAVSVLVEGIHAVGVLVEGVHAVDSLANDDLAIGLLSIDTLTANHLTHGSLAHSILAVGIFVLHRTSIDPFLPHPGDLRVILESSDDTRVKAKQDERWKIV